MKRHAAALALVGLIPASMLFCAALILFFRAQKAYSVLQLLGSGCLMVVVLAHISEALDLFPWMGWGQQHSIGHYLDLSGAVLGLISFPAGYLLQALADRRN
jgi:hypothetical protein